MDRTRDTTANSGPRPGEHLHAKYDHARSHGFARGDQLALGRGHHVGTRLRPLKLTDASAQRSRSQSCTRSGELGTGQKGGQRNTRMFGTPMQSRLEITLFGGTTHHQHAALLTAILKGALDVTGEHFL